jgi:t-SNARE complex subunit (syntaxin)
MYVRASNLLGSKIIIYLVFLLLLSQGVCAGGEVEELRKDILELEKIVNPFVRIFQKVSRLVAPSVVSIVAEY